MVVPCSSGKLRVSVKRLLVKTTLPAPIKAIFKTWSPFVAEFRDGYFIPVLAIPWMK
jgi:hypothetical protein